MHSFACIVFAVIVVAALGSPHALAQADSGAIPEPVPAVAPDAAGVPEDGAADAGADAVPAGPDLPPIRGVYEIVVEGATVLSADDIATAVYPFLGPDKTETDVAAARDAVEKAYFDRGYQVVGVTIPPTQLFAHGVVRIAVTEYRIGRLRIRNAEYTTLEAIRDGVPSLAEGEVLNVPQATQEIGALNSLDRRIEFVPGQLDPETNTLDAELFVEESLPLHGRLELNNRNTEQTEPLRLNAALRYDNLFQLGHSLSLFYQVAPQRRLDSEFISAGYTAPVPWVPGMAVEMFGYISASDVATVGGGTVVGDGFSVGGRATWTLPGTVNLFHQASVTLQYKSFEDLVAFGGEGDPLPIDYVPVTVGYFANLGADDRVTTLSANVVFSFRDIGSDADEFAAKRVGADGSFIYATVSAEHAQTLPHDIEVAGRFTGQITDSPLINNEQFSIGGLTSVRGFFETVALGDYGVHGGVELRSPSLGPLVNETAGQDIVDEWRVYAFLDGAVAGIFEALPEQTRNVRLVSAGFGSRIRLLDAINGSVDVGFPIVRVGIADSAEKRVFFSLSAGM